MLVIILGVVSILHAQPPCFTSAGALTYPPFKILFLLHLIDCRRFTEVNDTLYVYVVERQHAAGEPSPNMCEYISSIYSRMWDEMMQADNLSLNCIVIGDLKDSGYVSLPELRAKKELAALYTFDRTAAQQVQDLRQRCGLQKVSLLEYDATSAVLSQPQLVEGGQIHFLDSATGGMPLPRFSRVAIGGTFDRLHNGHKKLLALAAGCTSGVLVVGISGDALLANKRNASKISSYAVRQQEVLNFLRLVKPLLVVEPVELSDPYGPTVTDASIEALVASSETLPGAEKINKLRKEKGFQPLAVLISRRGDSATLSSTFLRANAK